VRWRLVEGVRDEDLRRLLAVARRRTFSRHEVVFHRDDPADSLHLVTKGRFAIRIITPFGETATIAIRRPGDTFGEMALVAEGLKRSATVEALDEAETFAVHVDDFRRLRAEHPSVSQVLIQFLADEVRRQNALLLETLYVPAERRVVRRLVELAADAADGLIRLTQEQIAELAGTSRATVNRVLRDEQARGSLRLARGTVAVVDRDALERRAG
jgi:CRP/FNR family transcriptional regulator, cyclic AMP receptor protein